MQLWREDEDSMQEEGKDPLSPPPLENCGATSSLKSDGASIV